MKAEAADVHQLQEHMQHVVGRLNDIDAMLRAVLAGQRTSGTVPLDTAVVQPSWPNNSGPRTVEVDEEVTGEVRFVDRIGALCFTDLPVRSSMQDRPVAPAIDPQVAQENQMMM
jgi:hypothetical protein